MKQPNKTITIPLFLILLAGGFMFSPKLVSFARVQFNNKLLNNTVHYTPCEKLATIEEVKKIAKDNQDTINKIKAETKVYRIGKNGKEIQEYLSPRILPECDGKADMYMDIFTRKDREIVHRIIGGNNFFGVPVTMIHKAL